MREIAFIDSLSFSENWSEESYKNMENDSNYTFFKLCDGEKVIGFILLLYAVDAYEIIRIAVLPEYRGRGIGEKLIKEAVDFIKEKGIENIFLEVREGNAAARKLYEKSGFEECGVRKNYYSNPKENGIIMIKRLS